MSQVAALLLCVVALVHYGAGFAAQLWPDPGQAHRALFYIGQGAKGAILWIVIAWLAPRGRRGFAIVAVCAWGFFEDAQVAACRLARGIGNVPPSPGLFSGLCEDLTGLPLCAIGIVVAMLASSFVDYGAHDERKDSEPIPTDRAGERDRRPDSRRRS